MISTFNSRNKPTVQWVQQVATIQKVKTLSNAATLAPDVLYSRGSLGNAESERENVAKALAPEHNAAG